MGIKFTVIPQQEMWADEKSYRRIYRCRVAQEDELLIKLNKYGNISIVGTMPKLDLNEEYIVEAVEDVNNKYPATYIVESIRRKNNIMDKANQKNFLRTILTENQIKNIYEVYSEDDNIIEMIQNGTFDYKKVKGLGEKTFEKLKQKIMDNVDISEALAYFGRYDISYNTIVRLVTEYKSPQLLIEKVEENPYLLTEVKGIGFKKADSIAKAIGYDLKSPKRIEAALEYVIQEEGNNGNSWISYDDLVNAATELLAINSMYITEFINNGEFKNIVNIDGMFALKSVYETEKFIMNKLVEFSQKKEKVFETETLDKMIDEYCQQNGVTLEENQRKFFHDWNENNILLLIGYGGTGKSWVQSILLKFLREKGLRITLLAPTGKASKVMSGYTGMPASTIHRRIGVYSDEVDGDKFIDEDVIIVDETSMCDIFIIAKLFKAIVNPNARILFVGDDFQLPSVGIGNFLHDVINSGLIKVSRLTKVFRQKDGGIRNVSDDVRKGNRFLTNDMTGNVTFGKDCFFTLINKEQMKDKLIKSYQNVLKRYNVEDVVILTPTNKGSLGTVELNKAIQQLVNPPSPLKKEKVFGRENPIIYRVGDLVMNRVNTYQVETVDGGVADIFNGDTGKIVDIDEKDKALVIDFEGIVIKMPFSDVLESIMHSWCITIHKSQGSQYKVAFVIADRSMLWQLNANLLYTGFSRAKEYMMVLTQPATINRAMTKFANMERRSFLKKLLVEAKEGMTA